LPVGAPRRDGAGVTMSDPVKIQLILATATVLVAFVSAYFSYKAVKVSKETHKLVNGNVKQLVEVSIKSAVAEALLNAKRLLEDEKNKP